MKPKLLKNFAFLVVAAMLFLMAGCSNDPAQKEKVPVSDIYTEIEGDCRCFYASQKDILSMLKHGTGVVMFTWENCPWCHRFIQYVNKAAAASELEVLCYDIYEDREGDTDFYKQVVELLSTELDAAQAYDANGKLRIYVPDITFVSAGKVIGHTNETSMISAGEGDINAVIDEYWSATAENGQTNEYNLRKKLSDWSCKVCAALEEIEKRGCQACPAIPKK